MVLFLLLLLQVKVKLDWTQVSQTIGELSTH